jgi:hypothetical protein
MKDEKVRAKQKWQRAVRIRDLTIEREKKM